MSHFKEVCQYGYVHGQCRCPDRNKTVRDVECNRVKEHAPSEPLGDASSPITSSLSDAPLIDIKGALELSYDDPITFAGAIANLLRCGHRHRFIVDVGRDYYLLAVFTRLGVGCATGKDPAQAASRALTE